MKVVFVCFLVIMENVVTLPTSHDHKDETKLLHLHPSTLQPSRGLHYSRLGNKDFPQALFAILKEPLKCCFNCR